jgi:hypothetical protein
MRNDYKIRPRLEFKMGGKVKKSGKGFPDLTGDGKVTFKDVLKGRGVIKKKGGMIKKADMMTKDMPMKKKGKMMKGKR